MDGSAHFVATERRYNSLDLSPVAKAHDIARIPAALGTGSCLEPGIVAVAFDEVGRISKRKAAVDEGALHDNPYIDRALIDCPTSIVNEALTMLGLAYAQPLGMSARMNRSSNAGGCFLSVCILAGFPLGLTIGNPMKGILIGTGTGIALAVLIWLLDMRRRG